MSDDIQIKVVSVEITHTDNDKGGYDCAEVTYKNLSFEGKVEAKKVMSFVNKDVYRTLSKAKSGEVFTIVREKDAQGKYWQWVGAKAGEGGGGSSKATGGTVNTSSTPTPRSTYETPEERAKKQVYIVRQSSISAAIETLKTDKKSPTVAEVLAVAKQYEAFVFGIGEESSNDELPPSNELEDDIPF